MRHLARLVCGEKERTLTDQLARVDEDVQNDHAHGEEVLPRSHNDETRRFTVEREFVQAVQPKNMHHVDA